MSVLSVADSVSPDPEPKETDDADTNGQSPDSGRSVDLAERLSRYIEDFLTGLTLDTREIRVDWATLSPIFSSLSGVVTVLTLIGGVA